MVQLAGDDERRRPETSLAVPRYQGTSGVEIMKY